MVSTIEKCTGAREISGICSKRSEVKLHDRLIAGSTWLQDSKPSLALWLTNPHHWAVKYELLD